MEQTSYIKSLYLKIEKAWDSKLVIILLLAFWKLLYFFKYTWTLDLGVDCVI